MTVLLPVQTGAAVRQNLHRILPVRLERFDAKGVIEVAAVPLRLKLTCQHHGKVVGFLAPLAGVHPLLTHTLLHQHELVGVTGLTR